MIVTLSLVVLFAQYAVIDTCVVGGKSYAVGERFYIGCDGRCVCQGRGFYCTSLCPQIVYSPCHPSYRTVVVKVPVKGKRECSCSRVACKPRRYQILHDTE